MPNLTISVRKDVLDLSVPVLTEQLFITSIGVLNTIIASGLGKQAISAIGTIDSFNNIIIMFLNSLAIGGTVAVAKYTGQRNRNAAKEAANQALFSALVISTLITLAAALFRDRIMLSLIGKAEKQVIEYAISYFAITVFNFPLTAFSFVASGILRSTGQQDKPMKINIIINIVNVVLSYVLIYGIPTGKGALFGFRGLGVKGAGIAITVARLAGVILFIYALSGYDNMINLGGIRHFNINFKMQKLILGIGLPAGMESFFFNVGKFVQQIFIISLGTSSLAANTISWSVFNLIVIPGNAFSIVTVTMVGSFLGMREFEEAKKINIYLVKLAMACCAIIGVLAFPLATVIASVYSRDPEVVRLTAQLIRINAVMIPLLWPLSFIVPSGLRGAGDSVFTLVFSISSLWLVRVLLSYVFGVVLNFDIVGVWAAMYLDWILRSAVFYRRWVKGKWMESHI